MIIHFILLYSIFILTLIYRKKRENNIKTKDSNLILFIVFAILALFIGMRTVNIGTDTTIYVLLFRIHDYSFSNFEVIPQLISWFVGLFTNKYFIYLTILSIFTLIGIYCNAKKYKFDTEIFIFLYITSFCYLYSTSAVRFFCAFSIIMYSFKYMINRNNKKALMFIMLAILCHTSAIIFFPVYFATKFKYTKSNIFMFITIMTLFTVLINIVGYNFIFNLEMFDKYTYVDSNQNEIGGMSAFINIGILLFALIYYGNVKEYKKEYEFFVKMHIVGTFLDFVGIAYRTIWYFKFPIWFILPIILKNLKNNKKSDYYILYITFIIIYSFMYYLLIKNSLPTHNLLDYTFNLSLE